jgi:hypothetical protein
MMSLIIKPRRGKPKRPDDSIVSIRYADIIFPTLWTVHIAYCCEQTPGMINCGLDFFQKARGYLTAMSVGGCKHLQRKDGVWKTHTLMSLGGEGSISTLFVKPTGDILLLYDSSGHESNTVETESGLDNAHLADDAHLNGKSMYFMSYPSFFHCRPSEQPLQFRTSPSLDIITTIHCTLAVHNGKTHWIYKQLNKQVPGLSLPNNLQFITQGCLQVSKRTQIRLELWLTQYPNILLWLLDDCCLSRRVMYL